MRKTTFVVFGNIMQEPSCFGLSFCSLCYFGYVRILFSVSFLLHTVLVCVQFWRTVSNSNDLI